MMTNCLYCKRTIHVRLYRSGNRSHKEKEDIQLAVSNKCTCQIKSVNQEWIEKGKRLREARRKSTKSIHNLSDYLQITTPQLMDIEHGRHVIDEITLNEVIEWLKEPGGDFDETKIPIQR